MHTKTSSRIAIIAASLLLAACAPSPAPAPTGIPATTAPPAAATRAPADVTVVDEAGNTSVQPQVLATAIGAAPRATLSEADKSGLVFMREEEKLAFDVYTALYEKWGLQIFSNIAASERTHTDAVKALLDRYGIADPVAGKGAGQYTNPELQKLYTQLVAQGNQSLAEALKVGATVEDLDIVDLNRRRTTVPDIQLVYDNLTKGSRNHLRSFTSQLKRQANVDYVPQYLTQAEYNAIINAPMERGPNR